MIDFKLEDAGDGAVLKLFGELTIENAESFKAILIQSMKGRNCLSLDLTSVTAADVAGLQLLCSAHKTASSLRQGFTVLGHMPSLLEEAATRAGYIRHEGCTKGADGQCLWLEGGRNG